jgi:hypothetical protein
MKVTKEDVLYAIVLVFVGGIVAYLFQILPSIFLPDYQLDILAILIVVGIVIILIIIYKYEKELLKK